MISVSLSPLIVAPARSAVVVKRCFRSQFLPVDLVYFLEAPPVNLR